MTNIEIWKDIPNYEGLYQASNLGRIKSLKRSVVNNKGFRVLPEKIIKQANCNGYLIIMICNKGDRKNELIHRIIAKTFIDNPKNKPCVNHIDGNKLNNKTDNLEWCTYSENERHSYDVLKKKQLRGKESPKYKHGKYSNYA